MSQLHSKWCWVPNLTTDKHVTRLSYFIWRLLSIKNCNFQQYSLVSNLIALVPDKHSCWAPIFIVWPARTPEPLTLGPFMMNYTILVAISLLFIIICLVFGFFLNYTNLYPIFITPRVGVMNFTINDPTYLEMLYTE